jgi:hypothetical protein
MIKVVNENALCGKKYGEVTPVLTDSADKILIKVFQL